MTRTARERRGRSPAEIAAALANAKKIRESKDRTEGLSIVKRGQHIIFVVAGIFLLFALLLYQLTGVHQVFYLEGPFIGLYIVLGVIYYRNPYVVSMIAFIIYLLLFLLNFYLNPAGQIIGIAITIIKIFILAGLYQAMKNARKYRKFLVSPAGDDNVLDSGFINQKNNYL